MNRSMLLLSVVVVVAACGGRTRAPGTFSKDVGVATVTEINAESNRILTKHQFEIERHTEAPTVYIETRWRARNPFDDEQRIGIEAAQVRAIIRARPRSLTLGADFYSVDMMVEQRVRLPSTGDWMMVRPSLMAQEYAARIVEDFRQALDVGVHRR